MNRNPNLSVLAAAVLAFAATACDFSPSSPFTGFEESQRQGATLSGQFQQTGSATSSRQSAAPGFFASRTFASTSNSDVVVPAEVVVYAADGSELASVDVNPDGSFTLRGLPESFTLVFLDAEGNVIPPPMDFDGVQPNQEIDIVVAVDEDGEVVLLQERRTGIDHEGASGVEIEGIATNIQIGPNPMTGSLEVNGYRVVTRRGETSIHKESQSLTLEDLSDGDRVHVRGVFEGEDVFAHEIKLQEDEEEEELEEEDEEEKVTLCHIPPGNPDNPQTITVGASAVEAHLDHGDTLGPC